MVFSSSIFLYGFLPIFLLVYYLTPNKFRSATLTVGSCIFYGWWRPDFVLLMLVSTIVDYTAGRKITLAHSQGKKGKPWLWISLLVNLGLLGYFKYVNFGIDSLNVALAKFDMSPIDFADVILPVGISFYTFQTMSYTIDVYTGRAKRQDRISDFMSYVTMFPQLVAGPIVRYNTIADQLRSRTHTLRKFGLGVLVFQCGFAKKILLADPMGDLADTAFATAGLAAFDAWMGITAYAFQIYFDFSGYSDMAIGLGFMLGFRFPVNFNSPYKSTSITDFWRRWHISLSSWLRDYLYIPMGGNRKGV